MSKILVVDDSSVIRQQVEFALEGENLDVVGVASGPEALSLLKDGKQQFICMLLDFHMPEMNGMEVLTKVIEMKSSKRLPIYMLTTDHNEKNITEAKKIGAKGWIIKPFDPGSLVKLVKKYQK